MATGVIEALTSVAKAHAAWLTDIGPTVTILLGDTTAFTSRYVNTTAPLLHGLASAVVANDANRRARFTALLSDVRSAVGELRVRYSAVSGQVDNFRLDFTAATAAFSADEGIVAAQSAAVQGEIQGEDQQIQTTEAKIAQDRKYEKLGWLAGPLCYLIAKELGSLIDNDAGLRQDIAQLQQQVFADEAQLTTLTALAGRLATLVSSVRQVASNLTALTSTRRCQL
jgi:hypothetical protein